MSILKVPATERSPEIDFDFAVNRFIIRGESYPENVVDFYGPIIERLEAHLNSLNGAQLVVIISLIYFNSSSAKVLMGLFEKLDEAAAAGNDIMIEWHYEEDDDNLKELGVEFGEDLEHARFKMVATAAA